RLAQVVANLLDNAARYTEAGGGVVVRVFRERDGGWVSVCDTGVGIDMAMLPRVFDTFTQAEQGLDRHRGGLGLGLALVKGLVALHGGEVEARSEGPGRGAEFVVRLPISDCGFRIAEWSNGADDSDGSDSSDAKTAVRFVDPPAPFPNPPSPIPNPQWARRLLVVEDNPAAADTPRELLALDGHPVAGAHTAQAGVEAT